MTNFVPITGYCGTTVHPLFLIVNVDEISFVNITEYKICLKDGKTIVACSEKEFDEFVNSICDVFNERE